MYIYFSIEIQPRHVYWSESGNLVCLATDEGYFILKYNPAVVVAARETNTNITEDGIEDAFEVNILILHDYNNNNFKNYKYCIICREIFSHSHTNEH